MIQPQIVEYAKAQMKSGVSKEALKSALVGAGWAAGDVDESLKSLDTQPVIPAEEKKPAVTGQIKISQLIGDSNIKSLPAKMMEGSGKADMKPVSMEFPEEKGAPQKRGASVARIALAVIAVAAAGGAVYFYLQNRNLQTKTADLANQLATANARVPALTAQLDALTKDKNDLNAAVGSLLGENKILFSDLSFFMVPPNATSSVDVAFSLQGALSGNASVLYAVTSADGIRASVKNSKDANVNAALKNLVGTSVEISGTHMAGSKDVIVNSVNGVSVIATSSPAASSTSQNP